MCESPTVKTIALPKNRQISPAPIRVETEVVVRITLVVMSPSVRPSCWTDTPILLGRSPDLRVDGFKAPSQLPISGSPVALTPKPHRSQLRGQSRFRPHLGHPHRIPS